MSVLRFSGRSNIMSVTLTVMLAFFALTMVIVLNGSFYGLAARGLSCGWAQGRKAARKQKSLFPNNVHAKRGIKRNASFRHRR